MLTYILIGLLILCGATVQGTIGFGLGTIATPIIALVKPELLPTVILCLAFIIATTTLTSTLARTGRAGVDWPVVGISTVARIPGSLAAAWALAHLSEPGLQVVIACAVLIAMSLSGLGWSPRRTPANTVIAGVASGFLGTATSIGGPPMALILKRLPPATIRGTMSATFVVGCVVSLSILVSSGHVTALQLTAAAAYLPLVVVGLLIARRLNPYVNTIILNRIVTTVALSAAALLLGQALFELSA
ncbi:sulfite exporter TauE/SafE family protein [Corynebacterium lizhenjunii]|uniref:sulfite exporter TauE/SafE family protein n=1 Tax=Corynebacterium lizhenjunii TaxID=2709394 RepID=UPI0039A76487